MKILSRTVEIHSIRNTSPDYVQDNDGQFITVMWFHSEDYETQEQLNDASEIFADSICDNASFSHDVRITQEEPIKKKGLYSFSTVKYIIRNVNKKMIIGN
jgi:hypothetical protein